MLTVAQCSAIPRQDVASIDVGRVGRLAASEKPVAGPGLHMMLGNVVWGLFANPHDDTTFSALFPPWYQDTVELVADGARGLDSQTSAQLDAAWRNRCDTKTLTAHVLPPVINF